MNIIHFLHHGILAKYLERIRMMLKTPNVYASVRAAEYGAWQAMIHSCDPSDNR
jgi:hypothetical protein